MGKQLPHFDGEQAESICLIESEYTNIRKLFPTIKIIPKGKKREIIFSFTFAYLKSICQDKKDKDSETFYVLIIFICKSL